MQPTTRTFYAVNRGGGLYSEAVSQRIGALIAATAYRWGLAPTLLTLTNVAIALVVSIGVTATAPSLAAGSLPAWPVGLAALVGWQLAYAFDCADGQLARVTGRASPAGARLDLLCDVAAQTGLVVALSSVVVAYAPDTPPWLLGVFAGVWMVNLVLAPIHYGPSPVVMIRSRSPVVRSAKLVRDYGAIVLLAGLTLLVRPQWIAVVVWLALVVNCAFLATSIAYAAHSALRKPSMIIDRDVVHVAPDGQHP